MNNNRESFSFKSHVFNIKTSFFIIWLFLPSSVFCCCSFVRVKFSTLERRNKIAKMECNMFNNICCSILTKRLKGIISKPNRKKENSHNNLIIEKILYRINKIHMVYIVNHACYKHYSMLKPISIL